MDYTYQPQLELESIHNTLKRMGIQMMAVRFLYSEGILSFDPDMINNLDETQIQEILILRPFILAGTSVNELRTILDVLPSIFGISRFYNFNWTKLIWEQIPSELEINENTIIEYIHELEDTDHLTELKEVIETRLTELLAKN